MANMQNRINQFIESNNLDESATDSLVDLVNGCFKDYIEHMASDWLTVPIIKPKLKKLAQCSDAETIDELKGTKCTTNLLSEYCRTNSIRVGGTKKDMAERVWRHLQGESSDSDNSPKSKPRKTPVKEPHACSSCNAKGAPCGIAATEQVDGKWLCFRHS
jgi:hypothetical protein